MLSDFSAVEDRLRQALQADRLDPEQATRAEALLSRLVSPVRVAVMGPRGTGKTSVFNLLAGAYILPEGVPLPTAQIAWGLPPVTTCTYPDRSTRTLGAATAAELTQGNPIFISMQRDLPMLRKIALLEVVLDGDGATQARALSWAASRCDLIVWCTSAMSETEQRLLASLPPGLRKHALVALTRADRLGGPNAIAARLEDVTARAVGTSRIVRPIDARSASNALKQGGASVGEVLRVSGAEALTAAVIEKVDAGYARVRSAAESLLDAAVLNAARAVAAGAPIGRQTAQPASEAVPQAGQTPVEPASIDPVTQAAAPTPRPAAVHASASEAPRHGITAHRAQTGAPAPTMRPAYAAAEERKISFRPAPSTRAAEPETSTEEIRRAPVPEPSPLAAAAPAAQPREAAPTAQTLSAEGLETVSGAIHYLTGRGRTWARIARTNPRAASEQIMSDVLGDAEWLVSYLSDPFGEDEPLIAPAREMAHDILDLVQLMEMERTDTATGDAVCLLLQAQRRLQEVAAAA
ncbi:MAG: hypothetical protein AAF865_08920 [Pseudomonadota bacterium]